MSYFPPSTDKHQHRHTTGCPNASQQPRRAPNDFLDYNHGPDSYGASRRASDGRRWSSPGDDRKPNQRQ